MRKITRCAICGLVLALVIAAAVGRRQRSHIHTRSAPTAVQRRVEWRDSLDGALQEARESGKVVFIDFGAEWCAPCQEMLKETYRDAQVVTFSKSVVPVFVDIDKQPEVAVRYHADGIPALIFLDSRGGVLLRDEGFHDAASFLKLGRDALLRASTGKPKGSA